MTTNKKSNNIIAFFVFYLLAANFTTFAMDSALQEFKPNKIRRAVQWVNTWLDRMEDVILGNAPVSSLSTPTQSAQEVDSFAFTTLPKDIQQTIITLLVMGANAQSLQEAAASINSLAQVNHELNGLINDPTFCLQIIKHLARRFDCSDQRACKALQTSESRRRLKIQKELTAMCCNSFGTVSTENSMTAFQNMFNYLLCQGVDITFTYDFIKKPSTALTLARNAKNVVMVEILTDAMPKKT